DGISPDSARAIYYVENRVNSQTSIFDIYSAPLAGGAPPTGIAVGENTFVLGTASDDRLLLVEYDSSMTNSVYLAADDGSSKTLVGMSFQMVLGNSVFRPDDEVLFHQANGFNGRINIWPLSGQTRTLTGDQHDLISTLIQPAVSPDSQHVVYAAMDSGADRWDVFSVSTDGDPPVLLSDPLASQESADGLVAANDRAIFSRDQRLLSVPMGGGLETPLTDPFLDRDSFFQDALFPGGDAVKLEAAFAGPQAEELYKVPTAGGVVERLGPATSEVTGEVGLHLQSAGGQFVYYTADRDEEGSFRLFRAPVGGAEDPNVIVGPPMGPDDELGSVLALAPASNSALFEVSRPSNIVELWGKTFAGDLRLLIDELSTVGRRYDIVPPGHVIIVNEDGDLKEIDLATGAKRVLVDLAEPILSNYQIAENGSSIVFSIAGAGLNEENIYGAPINGGAPALLGTDVDGAVVIAPSGGVVLIVDDAGSRLVSLDGQMLEVLPTLSGEPTFTPDERYLIYSAFSDG
ncbi:MAG: hypothetical protein AAFY88_22105, partial [Acidobacteriota bacterium]